MSIKSNSTDLYASLSSYKPQILKIKITHFRFWIEKRLTELLDGLEDEILWSLVYNYLEAAQNRAKKEGPAANPSGGLKAEDIKTALSGFLGAKQATAFVEELFGLLKEAEENGTGIPAEFGMKPEEAVKEAFGIIEDKRKEMDLSQRVRREVSQTDHYNRRDYEQRERRGHGNSYESERHKHNEKYDSHRSRSRSRSKNRRHSKSRSRSRDRHYERRNDYYEDRSRYRERSRERSREDCHRDRGYYRYSDDRGRCRELRQDSRHEHSRDSRNDRYRTSRTKSPIPSSSSSSSSSSSASPSPCWESSFETSVPAAPRAPASHENVPNALEQALRAKALKALANKNKPE